jgi:NTE family protein
MTSRFFVFILLPALFLGGCAHYEVNAPLKAANPSTSYCFRNEVTETNSDDLLLALAFSSGGTRAAALSYGVLQKLAQTNVGTEPRQHRLLDDVGIISSVSGGSFTAAYYTLWGDRIFSDYEVKFLKKKVQSGLLIRTLAPWNSVRLVSRRFGSSDLAAAYYDDLLFQGAKFGDLTPRPGRPFLILNATDLAIGARFEFTQDQFDLIHSDLSQFPISRAVAASAAFPILLSPVILKNYSTEQTPPKRTPSILASRPDSDHLKNRALQERSYMDGKRRKFIHLADGGLSDDLGLLGPAERALRLEEPDLAPRAPSTLPRRLAIIIVDANTERDYGWDSKDQVPGWKAVLGSVGQAVMSHYTSDEIELFHQTMTHLDEKRRPVRVRTGASQPSQNQIYIVELHFSQMDDECDRHFFNSVPTSLQLPASTVDRLEQIANNELDHNPEFQRLIEDLRKPCVNQFVNNR